MKKLDQQEAKAGAQNDVIRESENPIRTNPSAVADALLIFLMVLSASSTIVAIYIRDFLAASASLAFFAITIVIFIRVLLRYIWLATLLCTSFFAMMFYMFNSSVIDNIFSLAYYLLELSRGGDPHVPDLKPNEFSLIAFGLMNTGIYASVMVIAIIAGFQPGGSSNRSLGAGLFHPISIIFVILLSAFSVLLGFIEKKPLISSTVLRRGARCRCFTRTPVEYTI